MESSGVSSIVEEWAALNKDFAELETLQKSMVAAVKDYKKLETQCNSSITHHMKRVTHVSDILKRVKPSTGPEKLELDAVKRSVAVRKEELRDMLSALPKDSGLYLKIVLGNVNVSLFTQEIKFKYKDEYERFKLAVTIVTLILSFLCLMITDRTLDALLHFVLVWYYCTLTIRESILVANGSRIKGWWRTHHFITTGLAGVLVLWHDKENYQLFRTQFMCYSCYISILQFLQYNYQQGCLYRLRALGERHTMDITVDGFHSWMWKGLKFLLPFLIVGYCWQLYNAYTLFQLIQQSSDIEWQVPVSSAIFLVLFAGNTLTTTKIVHQKLNLKELLLRRFR